MKDDAPARDASEIDDADRPTERCIYVYDRRVLRWLAERASSEVVVRPPES